METYFREVVSCLTIEDIAILGILNDSDAISKQKSIKLQRVMEMSHLTEAKFRKMVDRLVALQFIIPNKDFKEHGLFISEYGLNALNNILMTMEV